MAMAGPIANALGLQATLIGMSAVGLAGALAWLAQPSVRRLRRPQPDAPAPDRPASVPTGPPESSLPAVGAGGGSAPYAAWASSSSRVRRRARYRRTGPSTPLSERAPAEDQR